MNLNLISCADQLPPFTHSHPGGNLTTGRRYSDKVLALSWSKDYGWEAGELVCGVKDEDDWGRAPAGTPFWCDDQDLVAIHGDPDAPRYWCAMRTPPTSGTGAGERP
jgi:hypothetical protein